MGPIRVRKQLLSGRKSIYLILKVQIICSSRGGGGKSSVSVSREFRFIEARFFRKLAVLIFMGSISI